MLELRNLTKTYMPKKGAPVKALKGINLSFGETGLVFVLGKSGSGKSTLLNLIGGLDTADGGEIKIDGKSSRYFNASDYDAYRNTYIGFVFQEYNLLDDFTVGENISLALELQSQKADKQRLDEILKEVDLEGYADRKTNELSGGQKQRVAIARALVKSPKIIMADEPTGALDSNTGKAIVDTLKRLSKDKLVIVVSHDREFAEEYGDRVIELADGEIVADTARIEEPRETDKAVESKGEMKKSRLPYKRALAMGAKTMRKKRMRLVVTILLCFLSFTAFGFVDVGSSVDRKYSAQSALLLSNDNYVSFNASIKYRNNGNLLLKQGMECSFEDLERLRKETGLDFQGVIGQTNLALPLYKEDALNKRSEREYYTGTWGAMLPASQSLFDKQGYKLYGRLPENEDEIVITKYLYDQFEIAGVLLATRDYNDPYGTINGAHGYEYISASKINSIEGFLDKKPLVYFRDRHDSLIEFPPSTIVGVVDTNADPDGRIKGMKFADDRQYSRICRQYFYNSYHTITFVHQSLYDYYLDGLRKPDTTGFGRTLPVQVKGVVSVEGVASDEALKYTDRVLWLDGKGDRRELADNEIVIGISKAKSLWKTDEKREKNNACGYNKTYFGDTVSFSKMSIAKLRLGFGSWMLYCEEAEDISLEELELYKQYCIDNDYVFNYFGVDKSDKGKEYEVKKENYDPETMTENNWRYSYACYLSKEIEEIRELGYREVKGGVSENITGRKCGKDISTKEKTNMIFVENRIAKALSSIAQIDPEDYSIIYSGVNYTKALPEVKFNGDPTIVGIYCPKEGYPDDFIINNKIYETGLNFEDTTYLHLIAPITKDKETVNKIVDLHFDLSNDRGFVSNGVEFTAVAIVANWFEILSPIVKVGAIIVGAFSVLLLGNYIAVSITSKKREIGILRALGARKRDIFAIFINECIIITAIVLILSTIGLGIVCAIANNNLALYGVQLKMVHVGIRQIAVLLTLGVVTGVAASAIPLYKLSKKKPIDSISDR